MTETTVDPQDLRVGDKVRVTDSYDKTKVTVEGEVLKLTTVGYYVGDAWFYASGLPYPLGKRTITLLKRTAPKVGDLIEPDVFDSLPFGTLLSQSLCRGEQDDPRPSFVKVTNDYPGHERSLWRSIRGDLLYETADLFAGHFKILYLPPSEA